MRIARIVSGGQTGAGRGALLFGAMLLSVAVILVVLPIRF